VKDFLGNLIGVGDEVVFVQLGYRNLVRGTITKITPKTLTISHDKTNVGGKQTKQFHDQVVRIPNE